MTEKQYVIKQSAFPPEHGSWGLTLEPLVLGLLISYSTGGLFLALASFFFFLAHQPVRMFFAKNPEIKKASFVFALLYLSVAVVCLVIAFNNSAFPDFIPFLVALFLMSVFFIYELTVSKNEFGARLIAPVSIDFIALSIVLIGGMEFTNAFAFLLIIASRSVQSSFYIHELLKKFKQKPFKTFYVHVIGVAFLIVAILLALENYAPVLPSLAIVILILRAYAGFKNTKKTTIKKIGILEFVYGILFVVITALGYLAGI